MKCLFNIDINKNMCFAKQMKGYEPDCVPVETVIHLNLKGFGTFWIKLFSYAFFFVSPLHNDMK